MFALLMVICSPLTLFIIAIFNNITIHAVLLLPVNIMLYLGILIYLYKKKIKNYIVKYTLYTLLYFMIIVNFIGFIWCFI